MYKVIQRIKIKQERTIKLMLLKEYRKRSVNNDLNSVKD